MQSDKMGWTALELAAEKGHLEASRLLMSSGADVNAKDEYGWTRPDRRLPGEVTWRR